MADKDRKRLLSKEQLRSLIQEENIKTTDDIQRVLKEMFGNVLQEALEAELGHSLGYEKNDTTGKETGNRRNGHSAKTVRSEFGDVELAIPRDRDGEFDPIIVKKHQKNVAGIEDQILSLYARGVSTREIQDHFQQLYGVEVSLAFISNVTNKIMPIIKEWQNRPLQNIYAVVFLDAIHFKVKQDGQIVNKAAYMVLGIDLDGQKDVLGIWIGEHESAKFWLGILNELRNRGVQDILITCVDNLTGFTEAIAACYPTTEIQKCIVHQIRNSIRYVSYKDVKKITAALKPIYTASSEAAAREELDRCEQSWGTKYPLIVRSWQNNWAEIATFFKYPPEIRKIIYTTNVIESYHRQLRKVTKAKSIFPTDDALLKMLYLATQQESQSLSQNVKLGIQYRYQQGEVQVNHKRFLGYTKDENKQLVIDPEGAEVVKRIYREYLEGASLLQIARGLEADGILTAAGKAKWRPETLKKILQNEKYIGDALLQKTYTVDFLSKKRVKNNGIVPQYYVENSHEPIIPRELFMQVQEEMVRRANLRGGKDCGDIYRRVHWNNRGYKSIVWRCVSRLEEKGSECTAPTINEETLQTAVVKAINELLANKEPFLQALQKNIATILNEENDNATNDIDSKLEELQQQLLIQAKSKNDYEDVADEIYHLRELKQNALVENAEREGKRQRIAEMTDFFNEQSCELEEYDEQLVRRLIEKVTVFHDKFAVEFKSGVEIDVEG